MKAVGSEHPAFGGDPSFEQSARLVGTAKHVLFLGAAGSALPQMLEAAGCELTFVLPNAVNSDEARVYSSNVEIANLDETPLGNIFPERNFDVVLFDAVHAALRTPWRVLEDARGLLRTRGFAIALLPNANHGAIRLALLKGVAPDVSFGAIERFTLESAYELFLRAGYDVEAVERVAHPIFESSELLPSVDRADFSDPVILAIESAREAQTLQFVVKAIPRHEMERRAESLSAKVVKLESAQRGTRSGAFNAELEGTRRQAALNASAARRAEIEISNLKAKVAEFEARRNDMAARITQLEGVERGILAELGRERKRSDAIRARLERRTIHIAQLAQEKSEAEGRLAETRAALGEFTSGIARSEKACATLRSQLDRSLASLETTRNALDRGSRVITKLESARAAVQSQLERADAALDARASEIAALRMAETSARLELWAARIALRQRGAQVAELRQRLVETQARSAAGQGAVKKAETELERAPIEEAWQESGAEFAAAVERIGRLQRIVEGKEEEARTRRLEHEQTLAELEGELDAARAELVGVRGRVERQSSEIAILRVQNAEIPVLHVRAVKSEKRLEMLEPQLAEVARCAKGLEDELATAETRERQLLDDVSRLGDHARRLESDLRKAAAHTLDLDAELAEERKRGEKQTALFADFEERIASQRQELDAAVQRSAQLESEIGSVKRLHEASLRTLADVEQRLVIQTEELCATTQAESARIATLIDTVQSSHFWKLKNGLNRFLTLFRGS